MRKQNTKHRITCQQRNKDNKKMNTVHINIKEREKKVLYKEIMKLKEKKNDSGGLRIPYHKTIKLLPGLQVQRSNHSAR